MRMLVTGSDSEDRTLTGMTLQTSPKTDDSPHEEVLAFVEEFNSRVLPRDRGFALGDRVVIGRALVVRYARMYSASTDGTCLMVHKSATAADRAWLTSSVRFMSTAATAAEKAGNDARECASSGPDVLWLASAVDESSRCAACGKATDTSKRCGACKAVVYCDEECQRSHWRKHKPACRAHAQ